METLHFEEELLAPKGIVDIFVEVGSVEVETHETSMITVEAKVEEMVVTVSREENRVYVRAEHEKSWPWGLSSFFRRPRARLTIKIPAHCEVRLKTVTGKAAVRDVSAPVAIEVVTGKASLENLGGPVQATMVTGQLTYQGLLVDGDHAFKTITGALHLHLAEEPNARIDAKVITGHIQCDFPLSKERRSRRIPGEKISGILGDGTGEIRLRAITGTIHLDRATGAEKKRSENSITYS